MNAPYEITEIAHSFLGGSGVDRWATCTASALLSKDVQGEGSEYAQAGNLCHDIGEALLKGERIDIFKSHKLWTQELQDIAYEYAEYVNQVYVANRGVALFVEESFDLQMFVPEGFGTSDAVLICENPDESTYTLHVIDLKSGKGVPVRAKETWQLRYYALGAYLKHFLKYNITEVVMHICQTALGDDGISFDVMSVDELLDWAENTLKPAAHAAYTGEGAVFAPSDKACKWCRVAHNCRARLEALQIPEEFKPTELLSEEEILAQLERAGEAIAYYKGLQDWAYEQAVAGRAPAGWKLVEGRSTRKYTDELAVAAALAEADVDAALVYERSLLGVTALTKVLGKKKFDELVGPFLVKSSGKPTLVKADDPRSALSEPSAVFTPVE